MEKDMKVDKNCRRNGKKKKTSEVRKAMDLCTEKKYEYQNITNFL